MATTGTISGRVQCIVSRLLHAIKRRLKTDERRRPAVSLIYAASVCRSRSTLSPRRHRFRPAVAQVRVAERCCPDDGQRENDGCHAELVLKRVRTTPSDLLVFLFYRFQ